MRHTQLPAASTRACQRALTKRTEGKQLRQLLPRLWQTLIPMTQAVIRTLQIQQKGGPS